MRGHPLRVEQAPLYLHFTYSLCIHAVALALLVAVPVVGVSGMPRGGGYVVALTDKLKQPAKGGALKKKNVQPAGASVNTVGYKPGPVPIPSNSARLSAKTPLPTATVKPIRAQVHSAPLHVSTAGGESKTDALQTKREPRTKSVTSEAGKPAQSAAEPLQEKPSVRPDVLEVLPYSRLESVGAMPQRETTPLDPHRKIAPSINTGKAQGKRDASSSPNANGISPETRTKDPVSQSDPAGRPVSGGQPGDGGGGDVGTRNKAGTSVGTGEGYKLAAASISREFGLSSSAEGVFGEPTLARRGDPSDKDMQHKGNKGTEETPPVAIRVPEALLAREIRIDVVGDKKAISDISMGFTIKAHPANRRKHVQDAERKIDDAEIATSSEDSKTFAIKTLLLRKAEKGIYSFSLTNTGNATSVAIAFHLYELSEQRRMKEYKTFYLPPSAVVKFMFIMPEVLFWDDTGRFSGIIEDSHSVTKFSYETGLIWKEAKE